MPKRHDSFQLPTGHRSQRGLSLFELLVAIVVLAVLMAGISELVVTNTRNASATSSIARIQETGRTAMQLLGADIRRAGYYGGNAYPELIAGTLGISDQDELCTDTGTTSTDWGRMLQRPVFGMNDTKAAYACITDSEYLRGDVLTVRYTPMPPVDAADMVTTLPYLRTTMVEGRIFKGADKANAANLVDPLVAANYDLAAHTYFVGNTTRTCGTDEGDTGFTVPALFRKALDINGVPQTQELLAGVEHLQFRYKVGNGYLNADEVPNWDKGTVTAIETTVLVRAECPETGFANLRDFDMGDIEGYGPTDRFRRQVFTSVTQLRNSMVVP